VTPVSRFQRPDELETVESLRAELEQLRAEARARETQLERYAQDLREIFQEERARAHEVQRAYRATVLALSNAVEARDAYTGKHAERVAAYGLRLASAAGLDVDTDLEFGFLLHDVGKVAIPDAVLFKPGALDEAERALIATHPEIGSEILRGIDFLGDAKDVVRHHHERWDGDGYPDRLRGEDIPAVARVFAVADTLDALTTDRPYRRGCSWEQAREVIHGASGTQFDPAVVAAYDAVSDTTFARLRDEVS
jgi:ribonuclease P protein subunit RPR2